MMAENDMNIPVDLEAAKNRVMGDMEFLKEMMVMFEASIPSFLETIREAIKQQNAPVLSKAAHQFKGTALNLSVLRVAEKAAELDDIGKRADFENAEGAFEALERAVSDFREFMVKGPW